MPEVTEHLEKITLTIHPLPAEALAAFTSCFEPFHIKKKQLLTTSGNKEKFLYFITEGVQRMYYLDDAAREATILFTYPYSFGGVLDAFMLQQPSKYFYETLSDSAFLRASYTDLQKVRTDFPVIDSMLSKGLSAALSGVLERLAEIQCLSAEEKLRKLFNRSPHVFQLIPQKYLANYLGIDATNFSKFMNNVRL